MSRLTTFLRNPRLVLALGLACAIAVSTVWLLRATAGAVSAPVSVAEGATGTAAGVQWRLIGLEAAETASSGLSDAEPVPGAIFVVARFEYSGPAAQDLYCRVVLVGEDREWTSALHVPADPDLSAGCDGRPSGTAEVLFEIPRSALGEVRGLEVTSGEDALLLAGSVQ